MTTTVARLPCDEPTARRLAAYLGEIYGADDAVCAAFEDDGGRWQVAIHFRESPNDANLRAQVAFAAGDAAAAALTIEPVAPADWVKESLAGLRPVRAGRFVVHGAHDRIRVRPNDIGIEIEAALAFGTGHRVLAIAAARILRTHIVAGDIDWVAVEAARINARHNRAGASITFMRAGGANARAIASRAPYDLIFANILLAPLMRLAVPLSRLTARRAHVVLSGLLPSHANAALAIYRAQGFRLARRMALDGWVTLVLKNS